MLNLRDVPDRVPFLERLDDGIDDHSLRLRFLHLALPPLDEDLGSSLKCRRQLPDELHRHPELVRDFLMCQLLGCSLLRNLDTHDGVQVFHPSTLSLRNV